MASFFQHPERHLPSADPRTVASLVSAAADLTLLVGESDVVEDLSCTLDKGASSVVGAWRGRPLGDVLHARSRPSLKTMLAAARAGKPSRRFDLDHLLGEGRELPIRYSALGIGGGSQVVLMGQDLRPMVDLQARLLSNRQALDDNLRRQGQLEAHFRLLFETASEAILTVETGTGRIREANGRASQLFGSSATSLAGRKFSSLFGRASQAEVGALLARAEISATPALIDLDDEEYPGRLSLSAELFRAGELKLLMVRVSTRTWGAASEPGLDALVRNATEAVLLTDDGGTVLWVNESFLTLSGLPLAAHATGRPLEHFFPWSGVERDVFLENLRRHGRVVAHAATVQGANGRSAEVEMSAIAMTEGASRGFGFVMRPRPPATSQAARGNSDLTRTAETLVEMIGRVPMKDLVRDTTDVIEKMCIEAALSLTGNNRASAARVLGLSRQALYLKMERFGITGGGE